MAPSSPPVSRQDYVVMALSACAVLLYEIAITRVLSVVLWYHFAFLAISLAMLGLGAPGVWFAIRRPGGGILGPLLIAAGVAVPASVLIILHVLAPLELGTETPHVKVAYTAIATLVPLLLLGSAVCLLLLRASGRAIGRMYGADLLGAMVGAASVVPLLWLIDTPRLIAGIGLLPLAAALIHGRKRARLLALGSMVALLAGLIPDAPYALRYSKNYAEAPLDLLYERWTPTARLTVFPGNIYSPDRDAAFGWGFGYRYQGTSVKQYWIDQDGSAGTTMTELSVEPEELDYLYFDVTSIGYQLRRPAAVCIIGAGGGRDILTALKAGATHVDAVELNPAMIATVSEVFAEFSGDPYHRPGVQAHASEGRSFLAHTDRSYDLIQVSLIDSWAATTAGAYALSENYLYTVESMRLLFDRLEPRGLASVSRWSGAASSQLESLRLALLVRHSLALEGVTDPDRHFAVVQGGIVATLMFSPSALTDSDVATIDAMCAERGFLRLWPEPGARTGPAPPAAATLVSRVLAHGTGPLDGTGIYLEPPTDDRPFFFQNVRAFSRIQPAFEGSLSFNDRAATLPRFLITSVSIVTLALFFAPFLVRRSMPRGPGFWRGSIYFVAIGLGFMLVEAPLIQKFILYLGHPSYATTVVLSTLLLGTGLGSLVAGRTELATVSRLRWALPAGVVLVILGVPVIFQGTIGTPMPVRIALSLLLMTPLGVLLGFAFPTGMIAFGDRNKAWYWALNGAASVLATTASLSIAAYIGLSGVIWAGAVCYVGACAALPRSRPS